MKTTAKPFGLSAKRKAIQKRAIVWMIPLAICLSLSSCHEKTNGQNSPETKSHSSVKQNDLHKPKINIKVNRRYDDKGNVIGFDSTYSSYYSNVEGDTVKMDSLMHSFNRYLDESSFFKRELDPLFFNDSLRYPDFFHQDFFQKRYELNDPYLKAMMHHMDSIKNHFYHEQSKAGSSKKSGTL